MTLPPVPEGSGKWDDVRGVLAGIPELLKQHPDDLGALYAILASWGVLDTFGDPLRQVDLDNDGVDEVVLLLTAPCSSMMEGYIGGRGLIVLKSYGGKYVSVGSRMLCTSCQALDVPLVHDLTGDGRSELVASVCWVGNNIPPRSVYVYALVAGELRDLTPDPLESIGGDLGFADHDHDGRVEILLHGGAYSNAGAGPGQTRTDVYGWEDGAFRLVDVIYDPSEFRVHVVFDGDRALRKGDYLTAIVNYERAATDSGLHVTSYTDSAEPQRRSLEAFAYYRLVTVYALLGDRDAVTRALETLRTGYAEQPYRELAEAFWTAWQADGQVGSGCAAATAYAESRLGRAALNPLYASWGNPEYTFDDICFLR